jgi:hypothetical protein
MSQSAYDHRQFGIVKFGSAAEQANKPATAKESADDILFAPTEAGPARSAATDDWSAPAPLASETFVQGLQDFDLQAAPGATAAPAAKPAAKPAAPRSRPMPAARPAADHKHALATQPVPAAVQGPSSTVAASATRAKTQATKPIPIMMAPARLRIPTAGSPLRRLLPFLVALAALGGGAHFYFVVESAPVAGIVAALGLVGAALCKVLLRD